MLFSSFLYILVFLPIVVLVCLALQRLAGPRAAQAWILVASIFFYAKSDPFNLAFLFGSILVNWLVGRWIELAEGPAKKRLMIAGVTANVVYLCLFKYLGFLASMVPFLLPRGYRVPEMPFPLGISFFTITQIMYLVDCYEGILSAGSLFDHASFVAFFPYVISGPLGRAKRIRHQFPWFGGKDGEHTANLARGVYLFSMGLFKKTVFADSFARVATYGYSAATNMSGLEAWVFSVAYAMQLYFDFSGYSDMAIGSALMIGIEIPRNFDAPYSAKSIIEFWQRWHISLTNFITSYLYTPILRAFKRNTLATSAVATFLAMGIAGFWHGAAWTYIFYGFLHGSYLAINQVWRKKKIAKIPGLLSWAITFVAMLIAQIYFGSTSIHQGTLRTISLFNPHHFLGMHNLKMLKSEGVSLKVFGLPLLVGTLVAFYGPSSEQRAREFKPMAINCAYAAVLTAISFFFINSNVPAPFIYFKF